MMEFLYFPEDKTEYIPAFIMLLLFTAMAIVTMYWIRKTSRKEQNEIEKRYYRNDDDPKS
ncbi:hypothetical protein RZN22_10835 [Bacillaceae bacterium S4-13-58]